MAVILNLAILDSAILVFPLKLTLHTWPWLKLKIGNHLVPNICTKKLHSFILTQLDDGSHLELCNLGFSHFAEIELQSFIVTEPDDGSHLEFCHLGFSHLSISSQSYSHMPRSFPTICTKKPLLIHSDWTWWWQPSWTLPCWIQTLPSWIQTLCYLLSD